MLPLVISLRIDPLGAAAVLTGMIALFIGLYVVTPLRSQPRRAAQLRLRSCRPYLPWLTAAVGLKVLLVACSVVLHEQLATWRILPRLPDDREVVSAEFLARPLGLLAVFLAIALMAPLIEEFAFRGRMLHELEHALGAIPAIILTGGLFSVLHGTLDAIHHLVFGIFAGWVVWRTGSIWTAVYMHAFNNSAALLLTRLSGDSPPTEGQIPGWLWPYALIVAGLALGGLVATGGRIHRIAQVLRPRAGAWSRKRPVGRVMTPAL
jgi:membrane protease YdiL (CAAX protease family)